MRRKARIDGNHKEIRKAFRDKGASWLDLFRVGDDAPDGLVGYLGVNVLVEVKTLEGDLSKGEQEFFDTWKGAAVVCRDTHDVDTILQQIICDQIEGVDDYEN